MVVEFTEHLSVHEGHLFVEDMDLCRLADIYGTPLYVTSEAQLRLNFMNFKNSFRDADIYYAVKANNNVVLLNILAEMGSGADVFSVDELRLAILAGIQREKILFNGNSKSDEDITSALHAGVRISVDSMDELKSISHIAREIGVIADIAFRVNPDVSPDTHPKISTGLRTSKFGIPHEQVVDAYTEALGSESIRITGIHCHIGSQILELSVYAEAARRMMSLIDDIYNLGIKLDFMDIGGGLGIPYGPGDRRATPQELADKILPVIDEYSAQMGYKPNLVLEPGRYITGNTTILLTRVNTVKKAHRNFTGIDAGFNLLVRPAMYDAYHEVIVANKADQAGKVEYSVVGPICESGDILANDRILPTVEKGDLIAIMDAGAYGFSMSSQYNARPRCAEVLVSGGKSDIIRNSETIGDLLHSTAVPQRFSISLNDLKQI